MTSRSDDELVSSVLDGEASADERAIVASDPLLAERLAEFATVQRGVRTVDLDDGLADRLRLAAIDAIAADDSAHADGADHPSTPVAPVRSLAAHRRRRVSGALAAAAAVVIGLIGFSTMRSSDDETSLATGASTARTDAAAPEVVRAAPTADAAPTVRALGDAPDLETLAAAWRSSAAKAAAAVPSAVSGPAVASAAGAPTASSPAAASDPNRCGPAVGSATLAGRPVVLLAEPPRIRVLDAERCVELGSFTR